MCGLHGYLGYTQPLFAQGIMGLKNLYDAKPVSIYILGREAEGDLKRPFKGAASMFGGGFAFLLCRVSGLLFVFVHLSLDTLACNIYLSFCLNLVWISCSETFFFRCRRTSHRRSFHRRSGKTRWLKEGRVDLSTINSSSLHSVPGTVHILHFDRGLLGGGGGGLEFRFRV